MASDECWLICGGNVLASAERASSHGSRARGLLGRDGIGGALVLAPCRWVHTLGMRFAIDVAFLNEQGFVVKIAHMHRHRIGLPVWKARSVIEAEAGAFERWGLLVGQQVELRE